jgi:hypothetical protein
MAKYDLREIKLSNKTHGSGSDPDALLASKSNVNRTKQYYQGHVMIANSNSLILD